MVFGIFASREAVCQKTVTELGSIAAICKEILPTVARKPQLGYEPGMPMSRDISGFSTALLPHFALGLLLLSRP